MDKKPLGKTIVENSTDETGQMVKKVFARKISKLGRTIYSMVWQYYRDRNKTPVKSIIAKYNKEDLKIIYSIKPADNKPAST